MSTKKQSTAHGSPQSSRLGSPGPPQREQTVSYADLMKPDEDWRYLPNAADRRKIQNRLAQRAYRRSLRERNEEIKRLKKKVEKLEETQAQGELAPNATETDASLGPSLATSVPSAYPDPVHSATSAMSASDDWMGDYLNAWPHTLLSDHDAFAASSHNQVDTFDPTFPSLDSGADHLLQSVCPDLDPVSATADAAAQYPQYHGKSGSSSSSSNSSNHGSTKSSASSNSGSHDMFAYQSSLSPDAMCHTQGYTMDTGDSMPLSNFMRSSNNQRLRPTTSRSNTSCSGHSNRHRATGSCCCSDLGGSHGGGKDQDRQWNMDSLYMQGLRVEPSDCGDGVTIRVPTAADGRGTLFTFMIQRDGNTHSDSSQTYRTDLDGHH